MTRRAPIIGIVVVGTLLLVPILLVLDNRDTTLLGEPVRTVAAPIAVLEDQPLVAPHVGEPTAVASNANLAAAESTAAGPSARPTWELAPWTEIRLDPELTSASGRVLDANSHPVSGARLSLIDEDGRIAAQAESGQTGAFRLAADMPGDGNWQGRYVQVSHPEHVPTRVRLSWSASDHDIVLSRPRELWVEVHFDDGRPAQGAVIDMLVPGGSVSFEGVARTDEHGDARLMAPSGTNRARWSVHHADSHTRTLDVDFGDTEAGRHPDTPIHRAVELRRGARPRVKITSGLREREQLGRKGVIRLVPLDRGGGRSVHDPRAPLRGDIAIFPGDDDVRLHKVHMPIPGKPYRIEYVDALETVTLVERWDAEAGETDFEFDLPAPATFRSDGVTWLVPIQLLDASDDEPLDTATLGMAGWRLSDLSYVLRDADGTEQSLSAELGTAAGADLLGRWAPPVDVVLRIGPANYRAPLARPGDVVVFRLASVDLSRGTGRVRFTSDTSAEMTRVALQREVGGELLDEAWTCTLDQQTRVPAGTYRYRATSPWRVPVEGSVTVPDGGSVDEHISLEAAGALMLRDVGDTWPQLGARFEVSLAPLGAPRLEHVVLRNARPLDGTLRLEGIPAGTYVLWLHITGAMNSWIDEIRVEVAPGALTEIETPTTVLQTLPVPISLPEGHSPASVEATCWSLDGAFISRWDGAPTWRLPSGLWIVRTSASSIGSDPAETTMSFEVRNNGNAPTELLLGSR